MKHSILLFTKPATALVSMLLFMGGLATAQPLEGEYTIDASQATGPGVFASFQEFADALASEGISGNVTAQVAPGSGPYQEQVVFSTVTGSGSDATITIDGNGEVLTAITDTDNRHLLRLSNMSYVNIQNLELVRNPESTSGFYGVHIFGSGSHITISNCHTDMTGTTSTLVGAYIASGSETSILTAGNFHDITITQNSSNGGGYGASVFGLANDLSTNIVIDNNVFENFNSNGVYLRETNGAVVRNNHFDRNAGTISSCNAIQVAQNANLNAHIFNNIIEHTQSSNGTMTFRGIYLFNGTGHQVYNNVIQNIQLESGNVTGIEVRTGGIAPLVAFNTIRMDHGNATSGNLYGIKEELSNTNTLLRNNIVYITQQTSGNASGLVLGATSTVTSALQSDFNDLFVPDGFTAQRGTLSPTFYLTLANWQGASQQDANSFSIDPEFTSVDLSLPTNIAMSDFGITISAIDTDITGALRTDPPDVGAYEFADCAPPVSGPIIGNQVACAGELVPYFINTIPGDFTFEWSVEGNAEIVSGADQAQVVVAMESGTVVVSVTTADSCGVGQPSILTVEVLPLPEVSFNLPDSIVCEDAPPLQLTGGQPEGGIYSGPFVSDGEFFPDESGTGTHTILYLYTDENGCSAGADATVWVEICASLADANSGPDVSVFPNPFNQQVQLQLNNPRAAVIQFDLIDMDGRTVWKDSHWMDAGNQTVPLSIHNLAAGMYVLRLNHPEFQLHHQLIKQ